MKNLFFFINSKLIFPAVIYLFLTGTAESNWILTEKRNSIEAERSVTPSSEKKDSLPEGVTQDWLNSMRDERGNRIISEGDSRQPQVDPEPDALQRKVFNGLVSGSQFGYSISSAGDVNGDGFDDIIVGASLINSNTGKAYIYFGGLNMNTAPGFVLTGESTGNYFGYSVSSAGDVNGDGYSDVIVGAYGYNTGTGRAYVYFGGTLMNNSPDVILTGESTGNFFGISVSTAGDINGDGFSDVIVGAYGYNTSTGRAYIYYGGAAMDNLADVTMTGQAVNNGFGISVSEAGDENGDGYSDVIVGAEGYNTGTGRSYIYYGGSSMDIIADVIMTGEGTNNFFGNSVSTAGDVNGDGYSDVIVGADSYVSSTGRAYIFFGGGSMDNTADVIMTGEGTSTSFGRAVSGAGDVNGDGYSDVIVGAPGYNAATGRAYVFFGGSSMNNVAEVTITGESISNSFGRSVSSSGDVNSDGYADIIVGAPNFNSNIGRVYLYDYFMKNEIVPQVIMSSGVTSSNFGISVSSAGDVNGDGYSDVIVGANGYSTNTGRTYIFFGGTAMDNIADVTLTGEASGNGFGCSVSSAGDVNGDGYSDVIVGANGYSSNTGRAYIFFGGAAMDNSADVTMTGAAINNNFGYSVLSAGDVNGDGYSDVIAGAYGYTTNTGRAYVFLGGSLMDNLADVIMTGETTNNYFGISVSTARDVNGDGYSDVIVGASSYSTNTGRAYIYFGGASMDNTADVSMTGETTGNYFGTSVSSAGDVNGDGFSDVIIGANGYSSATGRAYIFFGGAAMDNLADVTMTGGANNNFGISVSSAGDVNGDGYSDVMVGAYGYITFTGKTFFFLGGSSMDNIADVAMTGENNNNNFGFSVSSAGDVNGDGYSDVITGANGYNSSTGRAYIFTGSAISIKPILLYSKDVPNDQGGKLNLKWARSGYDVQGNSIISDYLVQRSYPPSGGIFSWQNITTIPASHESFYTYTDFTPSDSGANNNGTYFYRIMARTNNINQSWRSNILSGRSRDNISPPVVSPFNAFAEASNVRLTWKRNTAPDLLNYILFRSTNPLINPYTATQLSTVTDSTYLDTSPLSGVYYYFIVAQDIHNNYSPVAVAQSPNINVNLTMFIEGFYNSSSDTQVSDTIKVFLRNTVSPFAKVDSAIAVVSSSGTVSLTFCNAPSGQYYIVNTHRNSLETWSRSGGESLTRGSSFGFDFSNSSSKAYGNNMKQVDASPVRFADYSGDINQDGSIDLNDVLSVYNAATVFSSGYVINDVTGDNLTDLNDILVAYNNSAGFVAAVRP